MRDQGRVQESLGQGQALCCRPSRESQRGAANFLFLLADGSSQCSKGEKRGHQQNQLK